MALCSRAQARPSVHLSLVLSSPHLLTQDGVGEAVRQDLRHESSATLGIQAFSLGEGLQT